MRFGELRRSVGNVSQKMLTSNLRQTERDGLMHRKVDAEIPPRVEYSLTETGKSLRPVIEAMCDWDVGCQARHGKEEHPASWVAIVQTRT